MRYFVWIQTLQKVPAPMFLPVHHLRSALPTPIPQTLITVQLAEDITAISALKIVFLSKVRFVIAVLLSFLFLSFRLWKENQCMFSLLLFLVFPVCIDSTLAIQLLVFLFYCLPPLPLVWHLRNYLLFPQYTLYSFHLFASYRLSGVAVPKMYTVVPLYEQYTITYTEQEWKTSRSFLFPFCNNHRDSPNLVISFFDHSANIL